METAGSKDDHAHLTKYHRVWLHLGIFGWETHLKEETNCSQTGKIEDAGAQVFGFVNTALHPTVLKHSNYVCVWKSIWLLHLVGLLLFSVPPTVG